MCLLSIETRITVKAILLAHPYYEKHLCYQ
ncbi:hypothetical protein CCP3SC5AM1_450009 [Gammaproteobacteria bacterium]